jgi:hypothetical protein
MTTPFLKEHEAEALERASTDDERVLASALRRLLGMLALIDLQRLEELETARASLRTAAAEGFAELDAGQSRKGTPSELMADIRAEVDQRVKQAPGEAAKAEYERQTDQPVGEVDWELVAARARIAP